VRWHSKSLPDEAEVLRENPVWEAEQKQAAELDNYGFYRVERLPGNIGYLDIRLFYKPAWGGETAVAAMNFIANTSALIIDLRKCPGGSPDLGEASSSLLGSVIVNQILIAALQRRPIPAKQRRPFHLIVDEFQNFATESFANLQSEARKYAVDVTVAHQYRDQLDPLSKGSTFNVGNLVVFRVTGRDSYDLASQFDNSPPPPETRVEPIYQEYAYGSHEVLVETQLNTGEGKLYQEVELPQRP
jgi:hypothetical protein